MGDYTQIVSVAGLGGTVNTAAINPAAPEFENYVSQLVYQHVDAYPILLGVPKVGTIWSAIAASHAALDPISKLAALRLALQRKLLMSVAHIVPGLVAS